VLTRPSCVRERRFISVGTRVAVRVQASPTLPVGAQVAVHTQQAFAGALQLAHWAPSDLPQPSHAAIGPHNISEISS
jgi:hypothetical protein